MIFVIKLGRLENKSFNSGGVGVVIINNHYNRGWTILLGTEVNGSYHNTYNLCAGSLEDVDYGCNINAVKREVFKK